jgi:hypothetical protein
MGVKIWFWVIFAILAAAILFCDKKYSMLRDMSTAAKKPYSYSKVQLAWWTVIIFTSFICILAIQGIPSLDQSILIVLGISAATAAAARVIDVSDDLNKTRHQNQDGSNIILDILSDDTGVSIHRFQAVILNLAVGIWFVCRVFTQLHDPKAAIIMPKIDQSCLILLGLSSGTYAALKATENKSAPQGDGSDTKGA